jgi:hypothetical protein
MVSAGAVYAHKVKHHHKVKREIIESTPFQFTSNTDTISPNNLLYFAQSLIGRPYR